MPMQDDVKSLLDQSGASELLKQSDRPQRQPVSIAGPPVPDPTGLTFDQGPDPLGNAPKAVLADRAEFAVVASQTNEPLPVPRVQVPIAAAPPATLVVSAPVAAPSPYLGEDLKVEEGSPDHDGDLVPALAASLGAVDPTKLEKTTLMVLDWLGRQVPRVVQTWYRKKLYSGIKLSMTLSEPSVQAAVDAAVLACRDDLDFIQGHVRLYLTMRRTWSASALGQQIIVAAAIAELNRVAVLGESGEA